MGAVCTCEVLGLIHKGDSIPVLQGHVESVNAICDKQMQCTDTEAIYSRITIRYKLQYLLLAKIGQNPALSTRNLNTNETGP